MSYSGKKYLEHQERLIIEAGQSPVRYGNQRHHKPIPRHLEFAKQDREMTPEARQWLEEQDAVKFKTIYYEP